MNKSETETATRPQALTAIFVALLTAAILIGCGRSEPAAKAYPLDVCIVSGEKLGSMGDPASYVHNGQEVKFCCKGCLDGFKKEPDKYLARLEGKPVEAPHDHSGHDHSGSEH